MPEQPPLPPVPTDALAYPPVDDVVMTSHGPEDECPSCYECPGCGGGDGSMPKRSHLEVRPGVVRLVCSDCDGASVLCPNYVAGGAS